MADQNADLHVGKSSHLSLPVDNLEFHLKSLEIDHITDVGGHYLTVIPCMCIQLDDDTVRFKQEGSFKVVDNPQKSLKGLFKGSIDLHKNRSSHVSLPVTHDLEFRLRTVLVGKKYQVGEHYVLTFPTVATSYDDGTVRLKQEEKVSIKPNPGACMNTLFNQPRPDASKLPGQDGVSGIS